LSEKDDPIAASDFLIAERYRLLPILLL
jgi:hypothetical protein